MRSTAFASSLILIVYRQSNCAKHQAATKVFARAVAVMFDFKEFPKGLPKVVSLWPQLLLAFAGLLTIGWLMVVIWFSLHLFGLM